jgi:hypothetical protein
MKKIVISVVVGMLMSLGGLNGIQAGHGTEPPFDALDQWFEPNNVNPQPLYSDDNGNDSYAQQFTPAKGIFTRVGLLFNKTSDFPQTGTIQIEIYRHVCDSIMCYRITNAMINPSEIPSNVPGWVNVTFDSFPLITEDDQYYIVITTTPCTDDMYITWWYSTGNPYPRGCAWVADQYLLWREIPDRDFLFRTYGVNSSFDPQIEIAPTSIDLGRHKEGYETNISLDVANRGTGTMYWEVDPASIRPTGLLIHFSDNFGFLSAGENQTVILRITIGGNEMGTYIHHGGQTSKEKELIFLSNGGTVTVTITWVLDFAYEIYSVRTIQTYTNPIPGHA